ncbi:hypothetical protein H8L32_18105 [Undibacterium sp. CY18W]|uniref:Uncharacterized protein n=1 Tax=Undibacterium hunanense TaxID=2762292 RepID=A0ABR6ZV69_9BURK|nr:hypothetical protein [Undibacterium hunanense]
MGIQVIVRARVASDIESALGNIALECEIFSIDSSSWGISIPTKLIDVVGEKNVREFLGKFDHFDLWTGVWIPAKPRWKFW